MRIAIALLLLTGSAAADPSNELTLGSWNRTLRTDSANAITEDSLGGGTLTYAHALAISPLPDVALWTTGRFEWGAADGRMFQTLTTELDTLAVTGGLRARYEIRSRIVGSARIDLGAARAAVAIRDDQNHSATDHGWGAIAAGVLGLDVYAIYRARVTLGLRLELGYVATTGVPLTATPETASEGTLQLEMTAAALGSLNLSGAVFGATIVSQF